MTYSQTDQSTIDKKQHGFLMANIIIMGTVMTILGFAMFDYANTARANLENSFLRHLAQEASQSGIEYAYDQVSKSSTYSGTAAPIGCNSSDPTRTPYVSNDSSFCTTFNVYKAADGSFHSIGVVYRKLSSSVQNQIYSYNFTASIPGSTAAPTYTGATTPFTGSTNAPVGSEGHSIVYNNGYAYIFGGCTTSSRTPSSRVEYTVVNPGGTLGVWQSLPSLPVALCDHSASGVYNNTIYLAGGNVSSSTGYIYYSTINADGTLGAWKSVAAPITNNNYALGSVQIYNGYLYLIGGSYNQKFTPTTQWISRAIINGDGTLGSFITQSNWFAGNSSFCSTSTVANGYLYTYGQGLVFYGKFNADGSVSPATISSFPAVPDCPTLMTANNNLYMLAGLVNDVYYAPINPASGVVGTWVHSPNSLPDVRDEGGSFIANGFIYYINGFNNPFPYEYSNVWYATLQ